MKTDTITELLGSIVIIALALWFFLSCLIYANTSILSPTNFWYWFGLFWEVIP